MTNSSPNEPTRDTMAAVGQLCMAWSYVEMQSERTLWGILGLNAQQGEAFVWRMQLPQRWQMIVKEARKRFAEEEVNELKVIKKLVDATQRDRNIVVHGVVHAMAIVQGQLSHGDNAGTHENPPPFGRKPCWTIYMGDDAGKNFPISATAVGVIVENAQKTGKLILDYNNRKGYIAGTPLAETVEQDWPLRL
jgi:hypothetical protein